MFSRSEPNDESESMNSENDSMMESISEEQQIGLEQLILRGQAHQQTLMQEQTAVIKSFIDQQGQFFQQQTLVFQQHLQLLSAAQQQRVEPVAPVILIKPSLKTS